MCCAPIVYMFVYILIGAHIVPLRRFAHENNDKECVCGRRELGKMKYADIVELTVTRTMLCAIILIIMLVCTVRVQFYIIL